MNLFEKYYGKSFRVILSIINPFKKKVIKTECRVHRFINYQSLKILEKYGYYHEFELYNYNLENMNRGTVWADQDFKSIGHFYNPIKNRGLYGHTNALKLTNKYYNKAKYYWRKNNRERALFYLGASIHIIQDVTIPQHVNIRLLDNHRQYENFVKMTYNSVKEFRSLEKPILFKNPKDYVKFNSKTALKIYKQHKDIDDNYRRYYYITLCSLPLAQRTTAGCLILFLREVGY